MRSGSPDNEVDASMDVVEKDDEIPVAVNWSGALDLYLAARKDDEDYARDNAGGVTQVPIDLNQQQLQGAPNSFTLVNGSSDREMENNDHLGISNVLSEDKSFGDIEEKDGYMEEAADDFRVGCFSQEKVVVSHYKKAEDIPDGALELRNRGNHNFGTSDGELRMEETVRCVGKSDNVSSKSEIGNTDNDDRVGDSAAETYENQHHRDERCEGPLDFHLKINHMEQFSDDMQKLENQQSLPNSEMIGGEKSDPLFSSKDQLRRATSPDRNASASPRRSPVVKKMSSRGNASQYSPKSGSQELHAHQHEVPNPALNKHHTSHQASPRNHFEQKRTSEDNFQEHKERQNLPPNKSSDSPGSLHEPDSRRREDSSQGRLSSSPKGRYSSPGSHRRHGHSVSRSPSRHKERKDASSGSRRDYRDRSRSRSPYTRDHYRRSPRRRYSPRQRSPPSAYRSHHRSPRRQWSPPPNRSTGAGKPGNSLFVAGFSFVTTERDLERKFSRFGRVTDVRIVRDRRSGDSRGFGFLSLERDEDADAAIRALDQTEWNGRIVLVEKSKTRDR